MYKRTWAEIDLAALRYNLEIIRSFAPGKEIIAVVKANAYGHGDNLICPELKKAGVNFFAVSCIDEALQVREYIGDSGDSEILIFGFTEIEQLKTAAEHNFILSAGSAEYARELSNFANSESLKLRIHVKVNTGMNRVGINTTSEFEEILSLSGLDCEAVYTHFSVADSGARTDLLFTLQQHENFRDFCKIARSRGLKVHSQNSGGGFFHSEFDGDFVRVGLALYGLLPNFGLKPVMSLKSAIHQIRTLEAGDFVSYGRTFKAGDKRLAAVVPVGYADGYSRGLSGDSDTQKGGLVAVNGVLCPVLGRVCMDQIVIDVTDAGDPKVGDEVLLYSPKFPETSVEHIAERLGTIPYEVICAVSQRVLRVEV
ncbi:MAG: alanine racemase [Oscillospiraceae bacterium]|nr:alanine racemase [Oscillospiraceae bacterium]